MISGAFAGCRRIESADGPVKDTTEEKQEDNVIDLMGEDDDNYGDIKITTSYVDLHYPEKWLNYLKTEKL